MSPNTRICAFMSVFCRRCERHRRPVTRRPDPGVLRGEFVRHYRHTAMLSSLDYARKYAPFHYLFMHFHTEIL